MQFRIRPAKILSLLVLLAVTNIYVLNGAVLAANGASEAGSSNALLGRLITTSNRPVAVNGGEAITGTTIFSGAQLTTSASGGAMVEIRSLGTVMIAPNSNVTLTFDSKSIVANVNSGFASVATVEGVK